MDKQPILFDAKELRCPEYQLQLRRFLSNRKPGDIVLVITGEPAAPRDTRLFCAHSGHNVAEERKDDNWHYLLIEVLAR